MVLCPLTFWTPSCSATSAKHLLEDRIEDRMAHLDRKLDFIVEELSHLKRVRNSAEDLVADLTLVGEEAMGDAAEALGSAALRPQEILHLFKSFLLDAKLLNVGEGRRFRRRCSAYSS